MQVSMDYTPKPSTSITGMNTYYRHCGTTLQLTEHLPPRSSYTHTIFYIVITIVERDTRKYHKFIAEYCYECAARVTIPKAMNE